MRRPLALLAVVVGCSASAPGGASPTPAATASVSTAPSSAISALVDIGVGLEGPSGLLATVYASGLADVSAFAFDAAGRLWAATAAYDDRGADTVDLIATTGAAPIKVITGLHTVLGLVWSGDTLYVASAGRVDAYAGLANSAFARRTTVLALPSGVGEVNGLVMSADGRLVLGVSAPCDACRSSAKEAAAVISFRPDGSDLRVMASGIRAPVGLAYEPGTADLFVTMNQRDDLGGETPGDWLAIVRSGQDWGFPDCYGQGGSACTGAPSPVAVLDPHAAVSGVAFVTDGLGPSVGSSAIVAEWATGKILRVALTRDEQGYAATVGPFLTGLSKPVPVATAPDGTLVVGDWGTGIIYRIAAR
jgi:glucose/arabinose dehydrogenase